MSVETKIEACAVMEGDELVHDEGYYIVVAKFFVDTRPFVEIGTIEWVGKLVMLSVVSESDGSKWMLFFKDSEEVTILERPQLEQS